jgi:hypothetical protein
MATTNSTAKKNVLSEMNKHHSHSKFNAPHEAQNARNTKKHILSTQVQSSQSQSDAHHAAPNANTRKKNSQSKQIQGSLGHSGSKKN